jgi:hypothetical protein
VRYERVKIKRDLQTMHNREVAPWEVPVLEFIFEDGNVERLEEFLTVKDRAYPDAAKEFARLTQAYGANPQSGVPYAASVYGEAGAGVRALRRAIEEAQADDEADAKEPAVAPAPVRKRRTARGADSLLG